MGYRRQLGTLGLVPAVAVAGAGAWLYRSFAQRQVTTLADGVHVISGGGGNTLAVKRGGRIVLVDTKFGPGAASLRRWVDAELGGPLTDIVNTHFHFDHSQGNVLFPEAAIWAHERVPALMLARDGGWWSGREQGLPDTLVGDGGGVLGLGRGELELHHPGPAHSGGDLFVYLADDGVVATGDLVFHGYYPFFDTGEGGAVLSPLIDAVRRLAADYPDARFVPGHGPVARAADLHRYADYLARLRDVAERVTAGELDDGDGVRSIRTASTDRSILPSVHNNRLKWATPRAQLTWCCELVRGRE